MSKHSMMFGDTSSKYSGSGDPYTRGGMDSYYRRPKKPHYQAYGRNEYGKMCIETITDLTEEEVKQYHAGYDENEKDGDHKDWG